MMKQLILVYSGTVRSFSYRYLWITTFLAFTHYLPFAVSLNCSFLARQNLQIFWLSELLIKFSPAPPLLLPYSPTSDSRFVCNNHSNYWKKNASTPWFFHKKKNNLKNLEFKLGLINVYICGGLCYHVRMKKINKDNLTENMCVHVNMKRSYEIE